jgi:hypothetical protein
MAGRDGPSLPPGELSLPPGSCPCSTSAWGEAGAARCRSVIEAQVEARRQARLQREEAAKSAVDAAKRPVGRPPKPRPDVSTPAPQPAAAAEPAAPPRQYRKWTADEKAFALAVLKKMCGGSNIRALDFLMKGRYDMYGPKDGFPAVGESHLRNWRASAAKAEEGNSGRKQLLQPTTVAAIQGCHQRRQWPGGLLQIEVEMGVCKKGSYTGGAGGSKKCVPQNFVGLPQTLGKVQKLEGPSANLLKRKIFWSSTV